MSVAPAERAAGGDARSQESLDAATAADPWGLHPNLSAPRRKLPTLLPALLIAAALCFITFYAKGGLNPLNIEPMTALEIALTLGCAVVIALTVVLTPATRPVHGLWPLGLLLAFTALTAISLAWSVQPDESWLDAGRMIAYSALFAAALALARAVPGRWNALLGGILGAAVVVCGYALATKIFPDRLDAHDVYARLRAPYDYWNAIGLTAAMGAILCLWLGARRSGHALLSALAYPAMGLMLTTLLLAYSRGALVALALGAALWFCVVPLRLRGAAVLISGAAGAAIVVAWDFSRHALSSDGVALPERVSAGHQLGVLLSAMLVLLTLAGLGIGFLTGRDAPSRTTRRRIGAVLLSLPIIAILALAGLLAHSQRGLFGSVSHGVSSLTNPNASVPANTPGRLTAIGSVRARYWNEALEIFAAHKALGVGASGYWTARQRYRTATLDVRHAHGFIVQTLSDFGLVGLALALALLAVWLAAAARATHPLNGRLARGPARDRRAPRDRRPPYTPERIGLLSMLCLIVVFGAHSLIDWTWYVPGDACVALLCAGWLAGRGELRSTLTLDPSAQDTVVSRRRGRFSLRELDPARAGVAAAILVAALLGAWTQWQPLRSVDASNGALELLPRDPRGALAQAQTAVSRDPLSAQALFTLATIQRSLGQSAVARATLQRAVRLQPSNPQTWVALGEYDLEANDPQAAVGELRAAVYLNPETVAPEAVIADNPGLLTVRNEYLLALRETTPSGGTVARPTAAPATAAHGTAAPATAAPATAAPGTVARPRR
jgi:tetratricopeptide (TPR) repeat protein